jgi:hypothetical protein
VSWDSVGHMGTEVVVQHDDTPRENAGALSLDSGKKISDSSTVTLCVDGGVRILQFQHQRPIVDAGRRKSSRLRRCSSCSSSSSGSYLRGASMGCLPQRSQGLLFTVSTPSPRTIAERVLFEQPQYYSPVTRDMLNQKIIFSCQIVHSSPEN